MEEHQLVGLVVSTRETLAIRMSLLADNLKRASNAVRRASTLDELSGAFNPLGEIQGCDNIDNLCGRLGAYIRVLEKVAPATKLDKHT